MCHGAVLYYDGGFTVPKEVMVDNKEDVRGGREKVARKNNMYNMCVCMCRYMCERMC